MSTPLMFEPSDPPTRRPIRVDADTLELVAERYDLAVEWSQAEGRKYVSWAGLDFWAEPAEVTA